MSEPTLPESAAYLDPLVGHWVGEGHGLWSPNALTYREDVVYAATGKPFLTYTQRTYSLTDGRPLHAETGYLRAVGDHAVELVVAQPTGFAEIHVGTFVDGELDLKSTLIGHSPAALPVTDIRRHLKIDGSLLTYRVSLAMNNEPLAPHLHGQLRRSDQAR